MNLSEAIERGAAQRPQGRTQYFVADDHTLRSCTFGAAYEGFFGHLPPDPADSETIYRELAAVFGDTLHREVCDPAITCAARFPLGSVIVVLNDGKRWSREQIAAWLRSIGE